MPEIRTSDLMKLLDLSHRLPLNSEITPIMAWASILRHQRFAELTAEDIRMLKEELVLKIRCHGFGAALEELQFQDALMNVFAGKGNNGGNAGSVNVGMF